MVVGCRKVYTLQDDWLVGVGRVGMVIMVTKVYVPSDPIWRLDGGRQSPWSVQGHDGRHITENHQILRPKTQVSILPRLGVYIGSKLKLKSVSCVVADIMFYK